MPATWPVTLGYTFTDGTTADADEVNSNFTTLLTAANELKKWENAVYIQGKNLAGTAFNLLGVDASNIFNVGNASLAAKFLGSSFTFGSHAMALSGALTTGGAVTFSGAYAFTGTLTAATGVTFPTTGTLSTLAGTETFTNKTLTSPTINTPTIAGGTHTGITSLGIRSTGTGAYDLTLANTENLTLGRTLTLKVNDAARTVDLAGNLTIAAAFTTSGANALTLTTTGATNVTLPTTGTLATLAGTETLSAKTLSAATLSGTTASSGAGDLGASGARFGAAYLTTLNTSGAATVAGDLTVSGTGTHTFGGTITATLFDANNTAGTTQNLTRVRRSGAIRYLQQLATNSDMLTFGVTGASGSETYTEAYRVENTGSYVKIANRLGIGITPTVPLHVSGAATITGNLTVSGTGTHAFSGPITSGFSDATGSVIALTLSNTNTSTTASYSNMKLSTQNGTVAGDIVAIPSAGTIMNPIGGALALRTLTGHPLVFLLNGNNEYFRMGTTGTAEFKGTGTHAFSGPIDVSRSSTSATIGKFTQSAASATVPVVIVKLGATPGAGGDALQVQDSSGGVLSRIASSGALILKNTVAVQGYNAAASAAYTLAAIDGSDIVVLGNASLRANIRTSEGVFTSGTPATNGSITLTLNGTTYKLMTTA